jgi:hypothetical protein
MKRLIALLLCVFGLLAAPLRAEVELSFDFYYDQLSPLGEWVEVDGYGYVWHPSGVDEDWAPYTDGYWTYTDAGWTWVSYEEWGGICYHYGRWVNLLDYGWCWVPGFDWGPAWVSWRSSEEYVGWAPLPPECDWEPDRGVSIWVDTHYDIGPRWYSFCRIRDFGAPVIRHVCLPRRRNFEICFSTVNITNITYNRDYGCVYNGGFDYDYIRARCDREVPALKLVQNTTNIFINNNRGNVFVNSPRGNALVVAAPKVAANARQLTRTPSVRRTFKRDAVARGWNGLDQPDGRERLVSKMRAETKGLSPANAKARPVKQEALAMVPKEAKLDAPTPGMRRLPAERGNRETAREGVSTRPGAAERERGAEKGKPSERTETAGATVDPEAAKTKGRAATAANEERKGGLRKRSEREAAESSDTETPAITGTPKTPGHDLVRPDRASVGDERARKEVPGRVAEREERSSEKLEMPNRGAVMREAQENARRQAQESAERTAREREEAAVGEKVARDAAERQSRQREQGEAARQAAERAQRQREAGEQAGRSAEMRRQAKDDGVRANAAREQAAEAAAARRGQLEAERARQNRASDQAEAAQRQAAQRSAENARRAEQQNEQARRQVMERQNEARQQQAAQRQVEAQREKAAQQNDVRQRAAEANRDRAMESQRHQAAEMARGRAMENQQRAAAAAQAQAQARAQAQAHARAEAQAQHNAQQQQQQRAAAAAAQAAARQQSESRPQQDGDDRKKRR